MLSVEEAQARVMDEISVGPAEAVVLDETLGRVLREDVVATHDMPPADNSAMDGYAVRVDDLVNLPVQLRVIDDIPAGHPSSGVVEAGTAMRIMTGAFVPQGADTVVQVELTDGGIEVVTITKALARGANIRRRGEDMRVGDVVLRGGVRIGAAEMAMLAAVQKTTVLVGRRPTVAILSTGDELIDVGETLTPGKIVNTNGHLLAALVREVGAIPRVLGIVRDTREATIAALETAFESDFVLSSGGVSVGAYDFVKEALEALGAETKFWRVSMKPGKPVVLSRRGDRVIFGLPGNPVSCLVSFHLFAAPALRKAMGQESFFPPMVHPRLDAPLRSIGDRRVYVRVHVSARDGELFARPLTSQSSGSLTSMIGANGLAIVAEDVTNVAAGAIVPVLLIGGLTN
ncbi:MAG TPA: gephyrin-like molybdotransferase Glp [Thermoanaerobaculia bacterium]|jgi:molybdopterin molybdotransferase|nr:gephyrin-like molybdotransferase Glp [Thermoanaerobaculia bacterium]